MTLKRAIHELEESFGILVVKRKLAENGIKGNDKRHKSIQRQDNIRKGEKAWEG